MRDSLHSLIRSVGLGARAFASAEAFLNSNLLSETNCLILDVVMPEMNGLELQRRLVEAKVRNSDHLYYCARGAWNEGKSAQCGRSGFPEQAIQ